MSTSIHPQIAIGLKQRVKVFTSSNSASDPSALPEKDFLAFYLYLFIKYSTYDNDRFVRHNHGLEVVFEDDVSNSDDSLNGIEILLFFYYTTMIPKNYTLSTQTYEKNKVLGLSRAAEAFGYYIHDLNYHIKPDVLSYTREFMNRNQMLFSTIFGSFISYATEAGLSSAVSSYAVETSKSVEYIYMSGVMMIEKILIERNSLLFTDVRLRGPYQKYLEYKEGCIHLFKDKWVYSAVLAPNLWDTYKRSEGFKMLWLLSAGLAEGEYESLRQLTVNGSNIISLLNRDSLLIAILNNYRDRVARSAYAGPTNVHNMDTANLLNRQFQNWTGSTNPPTEIIQSSASSRFDS